MNTETMTVHRALAELKTLDARISDKIDDTTFCVANRNSNKKINGVNVDKAAEQMKSDYQSITNLIRRRDAMKRAVVLSNAKTEVEIGGRTYTVAEAIEMKNHGIENKKYLLTAMKHQYDKSKAEVNKRNGDELDRKTEAFLESMYGSKDKVQNEDMERARKEYVDNNTYALVDPIQAKKTIDTLAEEIATFTAEVDAALSVSNSITNVEFSYELVG